MSNVEQKRRELFEREYCGRTGCTVESLRKTGAMYLNSRAQTSWYWFNAALDAVEINFPQEEHYWPHDYCGAVEDCRDAIEKTGLGLKVK